MQPLQVPWQDCPALCHEMDKFTFKTTVDEVKRTYLDEKPDTDAFLTYRLTIYVYGEEAGYCLVMPFRKQLNDIQILPKFRCEGIGSELIKQAIKDWKVDNLLCVALNGTDPARLQKFYERLGFIVKNKELMVR
jgi:ribosomal protein S18 acetylase RimI-like enzyme